MITETKVKPIERHGTFEEISFSIKDTAFILDLLRSKIYSNAIKTICQEISSNARDAHREVNKDDLPINIHLPSAFDNRYIIRDFGPGINPERMADVFVRYGASTKRNDNTQVGGFGIGAKTPWAYADSFGIETYCPEETFTDEEGEVHYNVMVKRVYIAYIDESRIGKLALANAPGEVTDEPQGTAIIVTAKKEDFQYFKKRTKECSTFWETRPNIIGDTEFHWPEYEITMEGEEWCLLGGEKLDSEMKKPVAIIDGIPYTIQRDAIMQNDYNFSFKAKDGSTISLDSYTVFAYPIRLYFKTGQLMLTANREEIDYKNSDTSIIRQGFIMALESIRNDLIKGVANAPDLWQAHCIWAKVAQLHQSLVKGAKWGKYSISENSFYLHNTGIGVVEFRNDGTDVEPSIRSRTHHYLTFDDKFILALNDEYDKGIKRNRVWTLLKANPGKKVAVVFVKDITKVKEILEHMNKSYGLDDMKPILLSKIAATPIPSNRTVTVSNGVATPIVRRKQYTRTYEVMADGGSRDSDFDLKNDTANYVIMNRNHYSVAENGSHWFYREDVATICRELEIEVVVVPAKDVDKLGKGWINLKELLIDKTNELKKQLTINEIDDNYMTMGQHLGRLFRFMDCHKIVFEKELDKDSIIMDYYLTSKEVEGGSGNYDRYKRYCRIAGIADDMSQSKKKTISFRKMAGSFEKIYPLLALAGAAYGDWRFSPEHFVKYCKACEEEVAKKV